MGEVEYTIFKTRLGWFGIVGEDGDVVRTFLPGMSKGQLRGEILKQYRGAKFRAELFGELRGEIVDYFSGKAVRFDVDIERAIEGFSDFGRGVLRACYKIKVGETVSYGELAEMAGYVNAGRAVGTVLSKNPLGLIVPCHRVIKATGEIGEFSAGAGAELKREMLELEVCC